MRPPPGSESGLFDERAVAAVQEYDAGSHMRWLTLSEDAEAMNLRRVLEHCWTLAGDSRDVLRKGLLHERWGQHTGAMAHLLALGLFAREGFGVECEPDMGRQSPDLLIQRGDARILVEVRAITGCGRHPWLDTTSRYTLADVDENGDENGDLGPDCELPAGGDLADVDLSESWNASIVPPPTQNPERRRSQGRSGRRLPREGSEKAARARARRRAAERAQAEEVVQRRLDDAVVRALEKKAAAYKELCAREDLPYVICLYQDTDDQLPAIVCDWAFGRGGREQDPAGEWHSIHDPAEGVFFGDKYHLGHVSAVLVFGREDDPDGRFRVRGDLIVNPFAERALPPTASFADLRSYRLRSNVQPPRMRWMPYVAPAFEIVPQP